MTHELAATLDAMRDWSARGIDFAMATVVGVRGSTYRGLGARQLISEQGTSVGTVSGGCLDQDLTSTARAVMEAGVSRIVEFDLTADDEAVWGWGIGCNGVTVVKVEPASTALETADGLQRLRAQSGVLVHELRPSGRLWFPWQEVPDPIRGVAAAAMREARSQVVTTEGTSVFLEVFGGTPRLLVCGAGHDAVPLVRLGADLGFEVVVVDDRRQFLTDDRFPEAAALVTSEPASLATAVDLDSRTYAVLITHNYLRDLDYLRALLGSDAAYIGSLGPGERLGKLLADLRHDGVELTEAAAAKLHGPAGVDIGAEGPVEIAWSILAEILAVRSGTSAGFLRDRKGPRLTPTAGSATK